MAGPRRAHRRGGRRSSASTRRTPSLTCDVLGTYELPAGCSVAYYPGAGTKDGHGVLARNFDFPTATLSQLVGLPPISPTERPLGADPWVVELRPDDGYASVSVGIMDVMGAMDGVNEAGLAVALLADNESPEQEPVAGFQVGLAEQQVVRYLLDTCADVDEAQAALLLAKHYYFFTPCHFLVADRSGRSFVWEHSPRRNREIVVEADPRRHDGRLSCTNHLLHRWPDVDALPDDSGPIGTAALTYSRWRSLDALAGNGGLLDRDDIADTFAALRFTAPAGGGPHLLARHLRHRRRDDGGLLLHPRRGRRQHLLRTSGPSDLVAERRCATLTAMRERRQRRIGGLAAAMRGARGAGAPTGRLLGRRRRLLGHRRPRSTRWPRRSSTPVATT